ncbi:hypothetical protein GC194_04540 [bacterium]|nr:hypothetical protein [bacterium]
MVQKVFYALLLCGALCAYAAAQQPSMRQLTDEDGLPSLLVYDIEQDAQGYIWVGTEAGLYRYNGLEFEPYTHKNAKASAVGNLVLDEQNRLWCQNFSDQIFYVQNGKMHEFTAHQNSSCEKFTSFGVDAYGVWLCHKQGSCILRFEIESGKKHEYTFGNGNLCNSTVVTNQGFITFMATKNGIATYHKDSDKLVFDPQYQFGQVQNDAHAEQMFFSGMNRVGYKNNGNQLFLVFDSLRATINFDLRRKGQVLSVFTLNDSTLWLGSSNGIYPVIRRHNQLIIAENPLYQGSYITSIFRDKENSIWIGTLRNGIYIVPNYQLVTHQLVGNKSTNAAVTTLLQLPQGIMVCNNSGEVLQGASQTPFLVQTPHFQYEIEAACLAGKKRIIIGPNYYRLPGYEFIKTLSQSTCKEIAVYSQKAYFATNAGTFIRDLHSNETAQDYLRSLRTRATAIDSSNLKWYVAYSDGLFVHQLDQPEVFEEITYNGSPIYAKCLTLGNDNTLWIGTMGNGLFACNQQQIVQHVNHAGGLLSDHINDIAVYESRLWIATSRGLQNFDPATGESHIYTRADGLSSNEVSKVLVDSSTVWVATARSLHSFPLGLHSKNSFTPPIYINKFTVGKRDTSLENQLSFDYHHDMLTISFTGLTYKSGQNFLYKYRTLGLDSSWQTQHATNNSVNLYALQPGAYTFQVLAQNEDGMESAHPAELSFVIKTPFTQTWYFYLLLTAAIAGITSIVFSYRIRFIRNKNEVEKLRSKTELEKSELQKALRESQLSALKVQLNPHFMFNALNSIQEFILLNESRQANRFLGKFADLMRITLDMSNQNAVSLEEEIRCLELYLELEGLRFEDTFSYRIEIDRNVQPAAIEIPSMLIQPYVENAIKHGLLHKKENRRLRIAFELSHQNSILKVEIEDNGIGRKAAENINKLRKKSHKPFATSANQRRLELLNIERQNSIVVAITDLDERSQTGTMVTLEIPVK